MELTICDVFSYLSLPTSLLNGAPNRYLHIGFRAPPELVERERVRSVWTILRIRHPLLASKIEMRDYNDVRFV